MAKRKITNEIEPDEIFLDQANIPDFNTQQFEGRIEKAISRRAIWGVGIFCLIVCIGFASRLWYLQIHKGGEFLERSEDNRLHSEPLFANRGVMFDRNGIQLAFNREDEKFVENTELTSKSPIPKREYISEAGFSHVLGFVSYPKRDKSGNFYQSEYIGKDGVEKQYNDVLSGVPGKRLVETDARQNEVSQNVIEAGSDGQNITLTIDSRVQAVLYREIESLALRAGFRGGAGVIMDIHTGEILAITSYPEYSNNDVTNSPDTKLFSSLLTRVDTPFINKAVQGLFVPGSTVKPFMAIAALEEGVIAPSESILSTGSISLPNRFGGPATVFRDWKAHGWVNMREAIAASSDVYFYVIGGGYQGKKGLGIERIDRYLEKFGFTQKTQIDLPGEKTGVIPTPEWKKIHFGETSEWNVGNTYHTSIGQYGFQLTPVELTRAIASLANDGTLITPHVKKLSEGEVLPTTKIEGVSKESLQIAREGMRMCVTSQERGTCKTLAVEGVSVAGKSGTAELGASKDFVNSWMTGFFPYDKPKYAFVIMMERAPRENTFGAGLVMREVFKWMVENTPEYVK